MRSKISLRSLCAISVVILTIGSFTACTKTENRMTSENVPNRAATPQEQTAMNTTNAPAGQTAANTTTTQERTVARTTPTLDNLQPGQSETSYPSEFKRLGYQVDKVDRSKNDRVVYDLHSSDNKKYEVSLWKTPGQNTIQRIETKDLTALGPNPLSNNTQTVSSSEIKNGVAGLTPGKNPIDYISTIDKWGKVTEYQFKQKDRAMVRLESNNKQYKIMMDVNPQNQKVTGIKLSG